MDWLLPGVLHQDLAAPLQRLATDGYALLGPTLNPEGLAALRERSEDLMLGRVKHDGLFFQMDAESGRYEDAPLGLGWQGPSLAYRKLEKLERDDRFRAWMQNPLFERIARALLSAPVTLYRALLFNKGPAGGSPVPWHQDGGKLWGLSAEPSLQLWTALDDAPAGGGCLEAVPRSHRAGLATPLGGVIPDAHAHGAEPVALPVRAGEVVLLHNHLWHRSGRGRPGQVRRAFSVCFMDGTTRCLRRRKAPRQFFQVFP